MADHNAVRVAATVGGIKAVVLVEVPSAEVVSGAEAASRVVGAVSGVVCSRAVGNRLVGNRLGKAGPEVDSSKETLEVLREERREAETNRQAARAVSGQIDNRASVPSEGIVVHRGVARNKQGRVDLAGVCHRPHR